MKQDLDFYKSYRLSYNRAAAMARNSNSKNVLPTIFIAIVAVIVIVVAIAAMYIITVQRDLEISSLNANINDPMFQTQIKMVNSTKAEVEAKKGIIKNFADVNSTILGYKQLDSNKIKQLYTALPAATSIKSVAYAPGRVSLSCVSTDKNAPSAYAQNLYNLGITASVGYTGFNESSNEVSFSLDCIIGEKGDK